MTTQKRDRDLADAVVAAFADRHGPKAILLGLHALSLRRQRGPGGGEVRDNWAVLSGELEALLHRFTNADFGAPAAADAADAPDGAAVPTRLPRLGGIVLRAYTPADRERVVRLVRHFQDEEAAREPATYLPGDRVAEGHLNRLLVRVADAGGQFVVAANAINEVIGYTCMYPEPSLCQKPACVLRVDDLYLMPSHRGFGLGVDLLTTAVQFARERGIARIVLTTLARNRDALAFYKRRGFRDFEATLVRDADAQPLSPPNGARNRCGRASVAFLDLLRATGVLGVPYHNATRPTAADAAVQAVATIGTVVHEVARVGVTCFDWTARQYVPGAPFPLVWDGAAPPPYRPTPGAA